MTRPVHTPSPPRQVQLVFQRTLRDGLRNAPLAFFAPTMLAGFVAIMFTAVFEAVADTPGFPTRTFIEWIGPGIVLLTAFVGARYGAGALLRDIETGYLDRLPILPVRPAALITGRALFEAVRIIPPATIVLVATIGLGVDNRNGVIGLAVLLGATGLVATMWNGIFFLVALKSQDHTAVLGLQPLFMPIVMFSTLFAPTDAMPGWFKTVVTSIRSRTSSLAPGVSSQPTPTSPPSPSDLARSSLSAPSRSQHQPPSSAAWLEMIEPALDEILSERDGLCRDLCVQLVDGLDITEGTMMGFPCLRVKGAYFASQDHRSKELIVKLDRARVAELVNTGIGKPFAPNGRVFKEWVMFAGTDENLWRHLLSEARAFCDV